MALIGRLGVHHNQRRKRPQTKVAGRPTVLIIAAVLRRVHVSRLGPGELALDPAQARHVRDVLRFEPGATVEVFDDAGGVAPGELVFDGKDVRVRIEPETTVAPGRAGVEWTIAAAVPKGERADWMVEKLSELGTAEFVPLAAARSVVLPEGRNKRDRWTRIATESAKQSRRAGVMRIGELTKVDDAISAKTFSRATAACGPYRTTRGAS